MNVEFMKEPKEYKNKLILNGGKNPDVLECLNNLSSDEVFTPVRVANEMLDLIPEEFFKNKNTKILDPFCKSGVFLREAAKRFIKGLEAQIPDLQERVNWIMKNCLYGIATTELCSLISRRSVYCSQDANGPYSATTAFDRNWGNIYYDKHQQHVFKEYTLNKDDGLFEKTTGNKVLYSEVNINEKYILNNKIEIFIISKNDNEIKYIKGSDNCLCCGANAAEYGPFGMHKESYAYWFIHQDNLQEKIDEIFGGKNMKFDVIIGNPPYQLSDGCEGAGSMSASPLYHKFVEKTFELGPKYISMIIPSTWMTGGKGLKNFREMMMNLTSLREIVDFDSAKDCFPAISLPSGVCYFLYDKNYNGKCKYSFIRNEKTTVSTRFLKDDGEVIIRDIGNAENIITKVKAKSSKFLNSVVSARKPYGFRADFREFITDSKVNENYIKIYFCNDKKQRATGYADISKKYTKNVSKKNGTNEEQIISYNDRNKSQKLYKVFATRLGGWDISSYRMDPILALPDEICTESFLQLFTADTKEKCENFISYINTKFFHFMLATIRKSQDLCAEKFSLVPVQDWSKKWTDKDLYEKYELTKEEQEYIESLVWADRKDMKKGK